MVKSARGFTLIEILLVIGIIAILAAIVIVAINPGRQFAQARNTQRWSNVNSILNAVHQNMADNRGSWVCAAGVIPTTTATYMSDAVSEPTHYDICDCIAPTYIAVMPTDPDNTPPVACTTYVSGYTIIQDEVTTRITVAAPSAEIGETISVTR